ncbi:relaxase domain-containing protein [Nocardia sp. NPDC051321]|uniref:relaxase domain-containing protein n=1 Tax=Nocardia sp. NPDC051321 TaxID=3364323 RepID=UPI0037AAA3FD
MHEGPVSIRLTGQLHSRPGRLPHTRLGRNGVRQVQVQGAIAATFDHRDSRASDPDLHTHVLIANRVRTIDGRTRSAA